MVQVNNTPITLRVKFVKMGEMQFISHLDLVRVMTKIAVRSKLPLYYTEGFNPIPKLVFAAPLSIGTVSLCEIVDIRLTEKIPEHEALDALNHAIEGATDSFYFAEAYYPDSKLTELKWIGYSIEINTNGADEALMQRCIDLLLSGEVIIEKKAKNGSLNKHNVRSLIKSVEGYMREGREGSGGNRFVYLNCIFSADPFLNPEHIIKLLRAECGILSDPCLTNESYQILRCRAYREDMSEFR